MHEEARLFTLYVQEIFPHFFNNYKIVLDVGSADINGNNKFLFSDNCVYISNDVIDAENVTVVCETKNIPYTDSTFDTIISTECFEHDMSYKESLQKIIKILKPGGLFVFTCASTDRPEHGTLRTSPESSMTTKYEKVPEWANYYKNLTEDDIFDSIRLDNIFKSYCFYTNNKSHDLYFWGIKNGGDLKTKNPEKYYTDEGVIKGKQKKCISDIVGYCL